MRLVADTSVLLGELLRASGRARLSDQRLELFISAHAWSEFTHELPRRIAAFARRHELVADQEALLMQVRLDAVGANIGLVEEAVYAPVEDEARSRSLLDPD